jgi:hypothetical protein
MRFGFYMLSVGRRRRRRRRRRGGSLLGLFGFFVWV